MKSYGQLLSLPPSGIDWPRIDLQVPNHPCYVARSFLMAGYYLDHNFLEFTWLALIEAHMAPITGLQTLREIICQGQPHHTIPT